MDDPPGGGAAASVDRPGQAPELAAPPLYAHLSQVQKGRKGQGRNQLAVKAVADAQLLLPPAPIPPPKKRGRPPKAGGNAAAAAPKVSKAVPEYKQVREPIVISDSGSDDDVPAFAMNLEDHAPEVVAGADAGAGTFWTRRPDTRFTPLF
jgi:hypothetical protein